VADQHKTAQAKSLRNGLDVIGHCGEIVPSIGRDGFSPAALVEGDAARYSGEPVDDALPSP
jgi:hypothetical protein